MNQKKENSRSIRLGIFVLAGTAFLILALYMIGNKRNLFSSTFTVHADFRTVNGLMPGHNVRYSGIDVGTVQNIEFTNDSSVTVTMIIQEKFRKWIRKNSVAAIGTDGLMGNKLVNITSAGTNAPGIENGDTLLTQQPIESDQVMRTLSVTNDNMRLITDDLRLITQKINNSNSIWSLLADTIAAANVRQAIVSIRKTGDNSAIITGDLSRITNDILSGKGSIGALVNDTVISGQLKQSIVSIQLISDRMAVISGDMTAFSTHVKNGEGTIGMLMMDTTFVGNLNASVNSLKSGADGFNDNMEALKHSFLLRKYFRKQEKGKVPDSI